MAHPHHPHPHPHQHHHKHADIEDLTLCSFCKSPFDEADRQPKVLSCKHHFCLECVNGLMLKGGDQLYCLYCWTRTEVPELRADALPTHEAVLALARRLGALPPAPPPAPAPPSSSEPPDDPETCPSHAMPSALWCHTCGTQICRACAGHADHAGHALKTRADAKRSLRADYQTELALMQKMLADIQRLACKQRDFLLKILEACTTLKTQVETDLVNNTPSCELADARECLRKARQSYGETERGSPAEIRALLVSLAADKERLRAKHREMFLQCKLDDLIKNSPVAFDFDLLKRALAGIHSGETAVQTEEDCSNPILFLANYCMSQLYSRHYLLKQQRRQPDAARAYLPGPGQNGNADYPAPPPIAYAPLAMPAPNRGGPEIGPPKPGPAYGELQPGPGPNANPGKPNYGDGGSSSLGSPNAGRAFQTEALSMALPNLLPAPAMHHSSRSSLVSPQPGQLVPGALPPGVVQHAPQATIVRNPSSHAYPVFYFNIEIDGSPFGRILIEVRSDVAPKMARNFGALATGELGIGYKGCSVFQCWENESIITGDFELNNGRGGRSIYEESFFMPDDTKILAIRGGVGMRRSQKRHDNMGLVGSQFRIILREMRGFTGIFAFVVEGLELVDRISRSGDSAGKPQSAIVIASCGKLN